MSLDFDGHKIDALYFVKIELPNRTLRYCNHSVFAKDLDGIFYFWEARLFGIPSIAAGFNDFRDSASMVSSVQISLRNGRLDSSLDPIDSFVTDYVWPNAAVSLFLAGQESVDRYVGLTMGPGLRMGPGLGMGARSSQSYTSIEYELKATDLLFKGRVAFPDSYIRFNEDEFVFNVFDPTYNDQLFDAPNTFAIGSSNTDTTFTEMEAQTEGRAIPVVYGDFTQFFGVPAFVVTGYPVDSSWTFKVQDSKGLAAGQTALKDFGGPVIGENEGFAEESVDLSSGTFVADRTDVLNFQNLVHCALQGKTKGTEIAALFGGNSTDLLEHPIEIIYDLIRLRLAVQQELIDLQSFVQAYEADTSLECRNVLQGDTKAVDQIRQLAFEFGFYIHNLNGKFVIKSIPEAPSSADISLDDSDILPETFNIQLDPNRTYFNDLRIQLKRNAFFARYEEGISKTINEKVVEHGSKRSFQQNFDWNYRRVAVLDRIGELLWFLSNPVQEISFSTSFRCWNLQPNDVIEVDYHIFESQLMVVRSVNKNLEDFTVDLVCWPIPTRQTKVYADTFQSTPTSYEIAKDADYGIFHSALEIVEDFNDTINFTTDGAYEATVAAGVYDSPSDMATAIQTALNAVSTVRLMTVTYDAVSRRFRIAANDASNYSIETTSKELGRTVIGFDLEAQKTGAAFYDSDYLCVFDTSDEERVAEFA